MAKMRIIKHVSSIMNSRESDLDSGSIVINNILTQ